MASLNTQSRKHARKQQIRPLAGSLLALAIGFGAATAHADDALPKLPSKTPLKVGFAQTESNNPGVSRKPRASRTSPQSAAGRS
jgi:hypothetical protein